MAETQHDMTALGLPSPCAAVDQLLLASNYRCSANETAVSRSYFTLTAQGIERGRNTHQKVPRYVEPLHEDAAVQRICRFRLEHRLSHKCAGSPLTVLPMAAAARGPAP